VKEGGEGAAFKPAAEGLRPEHIDAAVRFLITTNKHYYSINETKPGLRPEHVDSAVRSVSLSHPHPHPHPHSHPHYTHTHTHTHSAVEKCGKSAGFPGSVGANASSSTGILQTPLGAGGRGAGARKTTFPKVLLLVSLYSHYTRALTFDCGRGGGCHARCALGV
jgi:hypothetical protein